MRRRDPARHVVTLAGAALGTSWRVSVPARDPAGVEDLRGRITARLDAIVGEMSQWAPDSVLSRFNHSAAGAWTVLPPDFATVVETALALAEASDGAFDPTHGRTAALMGYGAVTVSGPPDPADLDAAHAASGWRRLRYDPATRRLCQPGGLWLDLSGIAKGFAVDALADLLGGCGHPDALIEVGGELVGRGLKPDGQPWWVDIETPPGFTARALRVALHEQALATSGDYVRGPHTIDPRTGRATPRDIVSVSVLHDSAMLADAWATVLTVLGAERALEVATRDALAARILLRDGEIVTPALQAMIDA